MNRRDVLGQMVASAGVVLGAGVSMLAGSPVWAQQSAKVVGSDPSPSPRNYLLGSDPSTWQSNVPEYRDWRIAEVYPSIDYVLHAHDQDLKSEWKLGPNANPDLIRIRVRGCAPHIDSEGQLILETPFGIWTEGRPIAYTQSPKGRREVRASYRIIDAPNGTFGYDILSDGRRLVHQQHVTAKYLAVDLFQVLAQVPLALAESQPQQAHED